MPDITMCKNDVCPLRERCYRFRALPKQYGQEFWRFEPVLERGVWKCNYFIELGKSKENGQTNNKS